MSKYKLDLHTHSILSWDGGITFEDYKNALEGGLLDYVAITDHNEVDFALESKKELGEKIIVGEEILTIDGEVIGLFLKEKISRGLSLRKTIDLIRDQGGLVYVPHPFDIRRRGIGEINIRKFRDKIDALEVFNSRTIFDRTNMQADKLASELDIVGGVGSDSHRYPTIGSTYSVISGIPSSDNLVELLQTSIYKKKKIGPVEFFDPLRNKLFKGSK